MEPQSLNTCIDTIVAPATPSGRGGIGVIRISGQNSFSVCDRLWSGKHDLSEVAANTAVYGRLNDMKGDELDRCIATVFRAPHSFTGEDTVEISVHGSAWIINRAIESLIYCGARMAKPGEFTQRAFLNRRIDLAQAEAIADLIASNSAAAHKLALRQVSGSFSRKLDDMRRRMVEFASLLELELDFSEEDVEFADRRRLHVLATEVKETVDTLAHTYKVGKAFKEGVPIVIAGAPNAGKSTLLNALLKEDKAIVTDLPGTTRDVVEDTMEINGILFRFIDTAGLRDTNDVVEKIGIEKARKCINTAAIVIWLIDGTDKDLKESIEALNSELKNTTEETKWIVCINKIDSCTNPLNDVIEDIDNLINSYKSKEIKVLQISGKTGRGINELTDMMTTLSKGDSLIEGDILITNARHYQSLIEVSESLQRAIEGIDTGISADFIAQDVRHALSALGTITGAITTDTLLHNIFSSFCIGK